MMGAVRSRSGFCKDEECSDRIFSNAPLDQVCVVCGILASIQWQQCDSIVSIVLISLTVM